MCTSGLGAPLLLLKAHHPLLGLLDDDTLVVGKKNLTERTDQLDKSVSDAKHRRRTAASLAVYTPSPNATQSSSSS